MKKNIHPEYSDINITCSCGNAFTTRSTYKKSSNLKIDVCNACHPFYTGKQRLLDTAGRIERFKSRYKSFTAKSKV